MVRKSLHSSQTAAVSKTFSTNYLCGLMDKKDNVAERD
jgi:hypothetical protein